MPYADPEQARASARRRYLANREARIAKAAAWVKANPERRAEWRETYKKRQAEFARDWYQRHREDVLARVRERHERLMLTAPDVVRASARDRAARRRARLRAVAVETVDCQVVWDRDQGRCGICGELADQTNWHIDHIVAIANGGDHSYANVQVAHPQCNWRKAAA